MGTAISETGIACASGLGESAPSLSRSPWTALTRLLRGCQQAMLYPADHPKFESALAFTFRACGDLLELFPVATLHLGPAGLFLMGQPCPPDSFPKHLVVRLRDREIPALTFREGVTTEELLVLLGLLRADPEIVAEQGGAAAWLQRDGVYHIEFALPSPAPSRRLDWEVFIAAQEPSDRDLLERLLTLCPKPNWGGLHGQTGAQGEPALSWLAEVLGTTAREMPKDSHAREDWLPQVALTLRKLTPSLQARFFRVRIAPEREVLDEIAGLFSAQEVVRLLVSYPNAVAGEASEQLAVLLPRLLPTEARAAEVEPLAKAALLALGMTEESYQNIVSPIVRRTLSSAPKPVEQQQPGDLHRVSLLTDVLSGMAASSMREYQVDMLLELIASSGEASRRKPLLQLFIELLPRVLEASSDDRAMELFLRAEEVIIAGYLSPTERKALRSCLVRACSPDISQQLARALVRVPSPKNVSLLQLLSSTETGFDALLYVAKGTSLSWLQGAAGAALLHLGTEARDSCYWKLTLGSPEEAIPLARALMLSGLPQGFEQGLWALEHPDPLVAAGLMEALAHIPAERTESVLLRGLRDHHSEVQCAAAQSLGFHPSPAVVTALGAFLANPLALRRVEVARSVVGALGQIGSNESVAALHAVLKRKHLLFCRKLGELWSLAAQTLATIPSAAAERALQTAAQGGSPEVAALCRQALETRRSFHSGEVSFEPVG